MPTKLPKNKNNVMAAPITTVADYLQAKEVREQRLWKLIRGKWITFYNGRKMDLATFNKLHPLPIIISFNRSQNNADHTKDYML